LVRHLTATGEGSCCFPRLAEKCTQNPSRAGMDARRYCATARRFCSTWYPIASAWLVHQRWRACTVREPYGTRRASPGLSPMPVGVSFVRPDSPLKPFSGRVESETTESERARLWPLLRRPSHTCHRCSGPATRPRMAICGRERPHCGGKQVGASTRTALTGVSPSALRLASLVAAGLPAPEDVYVLDACKALGGLRLLEINPS
jgi:hypothetical protein